MDDCRLNVVCLIDTHCYDSVLLLKIPFPLFSLVVFYACQFRLLYVSAASSQADPLRGEMFAIEIPFPFVFRPNRLLRLSNSSCYTLVQLPAGLTPLEIRTTLFFSYEMAGVTKECKWGFRTRSNFCNEFNYHPTCSRSESSDFCILRNGRVLRHQCCFVMGHDIYRNPVYCLAYHKVTMHACISDLVMNDGDLKQV